MLSWFRLLGLIITVVLFIASLWLMPVVLAVLAAVCTSVTWVRIVLVAMGMLWWALFRPWLIFRGERWYTFLRDLYEAFKTLFL